jgi:hypothetical protein
MMVLSTRFDDLQRAGGIDVALNKMAAESVADAQGAFEIHVRSFLEMTQRSDTQGLKKQIEGNSAGVRIDGIDRQAAPVDGDRIAQGEFSGEGDSQSEAGLLAARFDGADGSECFDESGKPGK